MDLSQTLRSVYFIIYFGSVAIPIPAAYNQARFPYERAGNLIYSYKKGESDSMNNQKIGEFISTLRKRKNMTQKDLADRLGITDKAVSKWERGAGCPDIGMLRPLAEILDTTVNELLDGEETSHENNLASTDLANVLEYTDNIISLRHNKLGEILAAILTISLFLGSFTSVIVNFAINERLTWSILVIDSCVLAGAVLLPPLLLKRKGIFVSLSLLTILIMPYLAIVQSVTSGFGASTWLWKLGFPIAITWLSISWFMYYLYNRRKTDLWLITFLGILLSIPGNIITNHIVDKFLNLRSPEELVSRQFSTVLTTITLLFFALVVLTIRLYKKRSNLL